MKKVFTLSVLLLLILVACDATPNLAGTANVPTEASSRPEQSSTEFSTAISEPEQLNPEKPEDTNKNLTLEQTPPQLMPRVEKTCAHAIALGFRSRVIFESDIINGSPSLLSYSRTL